jgi:hypothetical protein
VKMPHEMPPFGSSAFRELRLDIFLRKSFLAQSTYDQAAIAIAHELSHVVLDAIRNPLRRCEKAVDLTAMLLGFRKLYASGTYQERRSRNGVTMHMLGYLRAQEVELANKILAGSSWSWVWDLPQQTLGKALKWPLATRQQAQRLIAYLFVAACAGLGVWVFTSNNSSHGLLRNTELDVPTVPQPRAPLDDSARLQDQPTSTTTALSEETLQIQARLFQLGYLDDRPDGVWGARSRNALRAFKAANGLAVDDFWDERTMALLSSSSAAYAPAPISPKN